MDFFDISGILGTAVGIVAIPLSIHLARKGRQKPGLKSAIDFDMLIEPQDGLLQDDLSMTFKGQQISRMSRTYVAFWNAEGDTVKGGDIVASDPLRIQLKPGDRVLQARVVSGSRPQNAFQLMKSSGDPSKVLISFDFLDAGDGAVAEVVHEGVGAPSIEGTIRGAKVPASSRSANLGAPAIEAVRESSAWRRVKLYAPFTTKILKFSLGLSVVMIFSITALYVFRDHLPSGHKLADPADFDLNTLKGQRAFADRVSEVGERKGIPFSLYLIGLSPGLFLLASSAYFFRRATRRVIPASIANDLSSNRSSPSRLPSTRTSVERAADRPAASSGP